MAFKSAFMQSIMEESSCRHTDIFVSGWYILHRHVVSGWPILHVQTSRRKGKGGEDSSLVVANNIGQV